MISGAGDPWTLSDLDRDPFYEAEALKLLNTNLGGSRQVLCGEPAHMLLPADKATLNQSLGTLILLRDHQLVATLSLCPYSDEQITLWGPAIADRDDEACFQYLLQKLRAALKDSTYTGLRILIDERNRVLRQRMLSLGFTRWKNNLIFERPLLNIKRCKYKCILLDPRYQNAAYQIIAQAFPESGHLDQSLAAHEQHGYRHYGLFNEDKLVAFAAIKSHPQRSWIHLLAVDTDERGKGYAKQLLYGIMQEEQKRAQKIGLEVLADNNIAIAAYKSCDFRIRCTTNILTGAV